ncbi:MAG TPA: DUF2383 domain-containing protein [Noviherbaspirillum sp.]|jgi:uncharacterized protein (TIGR02284 family)|uniref:DUF2383 domain-containing protein n=1 Tax=Noviherbaspirillum sp. TaxID=1926288 RepID=UPI002DDD0BB1|nr:DUF2383 domain-containing protein [Noviherbaspirillum sp.]HEV2610421.1 DUF2383 domain-containing protein [Noviherbaspirillum sp.]
MLLRSEQQLALNDLESLCMEAADQYTAVAGKTADVSLSALFEELGHHYEQLAKELAVHIRALGDLPQSPDPDREAVDSLVSSIKAFFSNDERIPLIEERQAAEQAIAQAAHAALQLELPAAAIATVQRILAHAENAGSRLDAVR